MSYSNTSTGDKPADPYKAANLEHDVPLSDKIQDLEQFINKCKFGMMTTRNAKSGSLVSRAMALAATVSSHSGPFLLALSNTVYLGKQGH